MCFFGLKLFGEKWQTISKCVEGEGGSLEEFLFSPSLYTAHFVFLEANLFSMYHFHHMLVWWTCQWWCRLHLCRRSRAPPPSPRGHSVEWRTRRRSTGSSSSPAGRARKSRPEAEIWWSPQSAPFFHLFAGTGRSEFWKLAIWRLKNNIWSLAISISGPKI